MYFKRGQSCCSAGGVEGSLPQNSIMTIFKHLHHGAAAVVAVAAADMIMKL